MSRDVFLFLCVYQMGETSLKVEVSEAAQPAAVAPARWVQQDLAKITVMDWLTVACAYDTDSTLR